MGSGRDSEAVDVKADLLEQGLFLLVVEQFPAKEHVDRLLGEIERGTRGSHVVIIDIHVDGCDDVASLNPRDRAILAAVIPEARKVICSLGSGASFVGLNDLCLDRGNGLPRIGETLRQAGIEIVNADFKLKRFGHSRHPLVRQSPCFVAGKFGGPRCT